MSKVKTDTFAKTKILCTLGPATSTAKEIEKLILAGMDGIRMNFSHGDYQFYDDLFDEIDRACKDEETPLSILIDLQGPKIRVGELSEPEIELVQGDKIEITINDIIGTKNIISTSYKSLVDDAQIGDPILIDDGLIRLRIKEMKRRFCNLFN